MVGAEAELVELAQSVTSSLLDAMGFHASVTGREEASQVYVSVTGPELAPLIGRRGQTLDALDLLVNRIVAHRQGRRIPAIVDVERYRERRVETLRDMTMLAAGLRTDLGVAARDRAAVRH